MVTVEKNEVIRRSVVGVAIILILLSMFGLINSFENRISALYSQIEKRDSLITKMQQTDSLLCSSSKAYGTTISRYITNDCGVRTADGKKLTLQQLIVLFNTSNHDLDSLITVHNKVVYEANKARNDLRDSLNILEAQLRIAASVYDLKFNILEKPQQSTEISAVAPKLDSALLLLSHFRNRLRFDKASKSWIISYK